METSTQPILPPVPPSIPSSDEKIWIALSHLSLFIGFAFILPLIIYLVKNHESELVAFHAKEALNFHISVLIYTLCSIPLVLLFIGIPLLLALALGSCIFAIIACVKGCEGTVYRYPLTIRLV